MRTFSVSLSGKRTTSVPTALFAPEKRSTSSPGLTQRSRSTMKFSQSGSIHSSLKRPFSSLCRMIYAHSPSYGISQTQSGSSPTDAMTMPRMRFTPVAMCRTSLSRLPPPRGLISMM